jgi:hypothetical protein
LWVRLGLGLNSNSSCMDTLFVSLKPARVIAQELDLWILYSRASFSCAAACCPGRRIVEPSNMEEMIGVWIRAS